MIRQSLVFALLVLGLAQSFHLKDIFTHQFKPKDKIRVDNAISQIKIQEKGAVAPQEWPPLPPWRCVETRSNYDFMAMIMELTGKSESEVKQDDCYFDETICQEDGALEGGYHPVPC